MLNRSMVNLTDRRSNRQSHIRDWRCYINVPIMFEVKKQDTRTRQVYFVLMSLVISWNRGSNFEWCPSVLFKVYLYWCLSLPLLMTSNLLLITSYNLLPEKLQGGRLLFILTFFISPVHTKAFSPFIPNAPFLYPLKTSENVTVFCCFQGVQIRYTGNESVKENRWLVFWIQSIQ